MLQTLDRPASRTGSPVVEVLSADKVFSNGTRALQPVSLSVRRGEILTLIGPSGCGKSTLLKMIANLIQPSDGRVLWWRGDASGIGTPGRHMGFVFQDATLMPWSRVGVNVRLPLDLARIERREADARCAEALAQVGLAGFDRHYPRQLSGGMKMRVSIARALVTEPDLLLMDEPFGALDEITRNKLDGDLLELQTSRGFTCVFVTHSIYEAVFLSTRVVVMAARPGRIHAMIDIAAPQRRNAAYRESAAFLADCRALSVALAEASLASGGAAV